MDVKSTFLNGYLEEEVYIEQLEGLLLSKNEYYVCIMKKTLYGLNKAPIVWYSRIYKHLQQQGFKRGTTNINVYFKIDNEEMVIILV